MSTIQLTFPDGTVKEFPQGITALEVAKSIGPRLASDALVAKVDGRVVDLSSPIESSSPIQFVTPSSPEGLEVYRHSSAHLLAAAVLELFPDAHQGLQAAQRGGCALEGRRALAPLAAHLRDRVLHAERAGRLPCPA